jgi:uncharacterized lipoprotein YddW (UPF0748 family)
MKRLGGKIRMWLALTGLLWAGAAGATTNIVVIHGEASTAPDERGFSQSLARHAVRWLHEAGVDAAIGSDTNMPALLAGTRVAILIQLSEPPPAQMAMLRDYVQKGGRLIVCYSTSAQLADLMGVTLGGYIKGDTSGRWSRMRFDDSRPQGVPDNILQSSPNLYLAKPIPGKSQVLAWWEDRAGNRMPETAWLMSNHGYWMTHVLLADGDAAAKAQLLLALTASCDPALWITAAKHSLELARKSGTFTGPASIISQAQDLDDPAQRAVVLAVARAATEAEREAEKALKEGRGCAAWLQAQILRRQMELAYGWMQKSRHGEIRAIWDRTGMGLYPGDWNRTCQLLKDAGFSDLFVCMGGPGFSHYRSGVLPPSRIYLEQGDQLAPCVEAAHARGLRVHAWMFCFNTEQATPERMAVFRARNWLLTGEDGKERHWLDPSVPDVRFQMTQAARELATRYAVDGIHLDFVRYPDFTGSLGPTVRARFETATKRRINNWPDDIKNTPLRADFGKWRCAQITDFVSEVRGMLRREASGKQLTAAVYGKYPSCADSVAQDWESWLRQGYMDYLMPMDYSDDMEKFDELVNDQSSARWLRRHMIPGIGVTAAESRLRAPQVIDQILYIRKSGCPGFALFSLDTHVEKDVLPVLRVGITKEK